MTERERQEEREKEKKRLGRTVLGVEKTQEAISNSGTALEIHEPCNFKGVDLFWCRLRDLTRQDQPPARRCVTIQLHMETRQGLGGRGLLGGLGLYMGFWTGSFEGLEIQRRPTGFLSRASVEFKIRSLMLRGFSQGNQGNRAGLTTRGASPLGILGFLGRGSLVGRIK